MTELRVIEGERDQAVRPGPITQDVAALEFVERHLADLRFDHSSNRWLAWDGSRWRPDETRLAEDYARQLVRSLAEGGERSAKCELGRRSFARGVEEFARSDQRIAVKVADLDRDLWLLATPGGTVDLTTGELLAADPADLITMRTAVAPAMRAECPIWTGFLRETFGGDADVLVAFVRRWLGYNLTGDVSEHALMFSCGGGGNGKGVLNNTVAGILGDYAATIPMEALASSRFDRHPTEWARLRGKRFVMATETEEGRAWNEARIKQMTGGDVIAARFMRQDFFEYSPAFKLNVIGNHKPTLRAVDHAIRRRFNLLRFDRRPAQPDPNLTDRLRAEWPEILRWLIDGCLEWHRIGLAAPEPVRAATSDYFSEQDLLGRWIEERCIADPGNEHRSEGSTKLFLDWKSWAAAQNEEPGTQKSFGGQLESRGFPSKHTMSGNVRVGIEFRRSMKHEAC